MTAAFVRARPDIDWRVDGGEVRAVVGGVAIAAERKWWGNRWRIVARSESPIAEPLIVYVSRDGMEHGYWRDLAVGDHAFDRDYFVFCDSPAIVEYVVGPATRRALDDGDRGNRRGIALYVRGRQIETACVADDDSRAVDRQLAVHDAFAADHRAFLDRWAGISDNVGGRVVAAWPPSMMLVRPIGSIAMDLAWEKPDGRYGEAWDRAARSLRTILSAVIDAKHAGWSLAEVGPWHADAVRIGNRSFRLHGRLPISLHLLGELIDRAGITSVVCGEYLSLTMPGLVGAAGTLEHAVRIVELLSSAGASQSPYR